MTQRAGPVLEAAFQKMRGVAGGLATSLEKQQPVSQSVIERWVKQLRAAADALEKLL